MSAARGRRGRPLKASAGTRLARARLERGLTQTDMAQMTGLSVSAYWRLEHNRNPATVNLRELVNCALVLGVAVSDLFEDEWREWWVFDARSPAPPTL